ncbi:HAD-IA family hydrolase [Halosquirtibacter xylanolyticus]|uniref:HAD-IA family hydrolase n=1 Tax=Halosquirtibacter xylanolyticus TaxID=3374599 RepID=UPI00374A428B|nr:HAD-IA family hydrolase [Prolixibacteraceae bacterium]
MNKKVILFDFDGTLFNTQKAFEDCSNQLAIKYRFKMHESWDQFRDMTASEFFSKVLKISWFQMPFFISDAKKLFREKIHNVQPFEGIPELLKELSNFYELGIITSNSEYTVSELLKEYGMDIFQYTCYDVSIFAKKGSIKKTIKKYNLDSKEILYVGDEHRDGKACNEANIPFIAVSWGFNSKRLLQTINPEVIVDSPVELFEYLLLKDAE